MLAGPARPPSDPPTRQPANGRDRPMNRYPLTRIYDGFWIACTLAFLLLREVAS